MLSMWLQSMCTCMRMCAYRCIYCVFCVYSTNRKLKCAFDEEKKKWNKSGNKEKMLRTQFLHIHAALLTSNTRATHLYIHTHTFSTTHTIMKWQGIFHTLYIIFFFLLFFCRLLYELLACVYAYLFCSSVHWVCSYVGHPMKSDVISCIGPPSCINAYLPTQL